MGILNKGKWETGSIIKSNDKGQFVRPDSAFRHWITQDGKNGFIPQPDRYHLYVSYACPWASRTLMVRALRDLEDVISFSIVTPYMGDQGWEFGDDISTSDPLYGKKYLYEIYLKADPQYTGKVTVPVLWDKHQHTMVNNESSEIIRMLNSEFNAFTKNQIDLYPKALQTEINTINQFVYDNINNGVYKCGFAAAQSAYEEAFDDLFSALNTLEKRLNKQRYLIGNQFTEADLRLFTTLIRFDAVYVGHFKCNKKCIREFPNLWNYVKDIYQIPKVKETVNFEHIKTHYYRSHKAINPTGIIAKGPLLDFMAPHDRHKFHMSHI